ncbi:MAG: phosphoribosylformylglycinamidine cyclo-ligase [Betaproteobacteria bacterium]|nr:phosphoribosylformylglycinamidine cyclo-ligase [Betaproteobacteria bacterium]
MSTPTTSSTSLSYRDAGVDIDAGDQLVENIKPFAKRTLRPEVMGGIGGFGALVEVSKKYKAPVMVSGTDGVGTKLRLAQQTNRHDTIGIDLVAMSVNDILVSGAEPIFFLDYYVCEKLNVAVATDVVKGIASGCEQAGCALIGGETAEHPGTFPVDEYDLAGFAVGLVEKAEIITGQSIAPGDVVLGLASSGPHSNGFSLIRKILDRAGVDPTAAESKPLIDQLLMPTRIYVKPVLALMRTVKVKGLAHITGGGLTENVPRVLADNLTAVMRRDAWPLPPVFNWLQEHGNVTDAEMARTFNCGIGMVLIVAPADVDPATALLREAGETVYRIGEIRERQAGKHGASVI